MALDFHKFVLKPAEEPEYLVDLMYDDWYIVSITPKGSLVRIEDVPSGMGFNVNEKGQIRIVKAPEV